MYNVKKEYNGLLLSPAYFIQLSAQPNPHFASVDPNAMQIPQRAETPRRVTMLHH